MKSESVTQLMEMSSVGHESTHLAEPKTISPQLARWPTEPVGLVPERSSERLMNAYDVLLCFVPLVLIAKTILCVIACHIDKPHHYLDVDQATFLTKYLVEFNGQLSTAFTIVFITIITTFVRRLALWKAQKGAYISDLEQLQASISLPSTIKIIFSLQAFSFTSLGLLGIWAFYYLGSQACKLEYTYAESRPFGKVPTAWLKSDLPSQLQTNAADPSYIQMSNELLIGAMDFSDSRKITTSYDQYGNFLTPMLEWSFAGSNGPTRVDIRPNEWTPAPSLSEISFASLTGTSIYTHINSTEFGETDESFESYWSNEYQFLGDLHLNTSYTLLECSDPELLRYSDFPHGTDPNVDLSINMTETNKNIQVNDHLEPVRQFELWGRWAVNTSEGYPYALQEGSTKSVCSIFQSNVDLGVHCGPIGCVARQMRYSDGFSGPVPSRRLDDDDFASIFFSNLILSTGVQSEAYENQETTTQKNIGFWNFVMSPFAENEPVVNGMNYVTIQLSELINTYYSTTQYIGLGCDTQLTEAAASDEHNPICVHTVNKGSVYDPQYLLSIPWIIIDFISSGILFVAAIYSFWLRKQTLAPDISGYVSSLTRDNPHLRLPENGSGLSGLERARLLRDVKVKIADVAGPDGEVGRVGIIYVGDGVTVEHLHKERKYA